jgi:hypothetical protein
MYTFELTFGQFWTRRWRLEFSTPTNDQKIGMRILRLARFQSQLRYTLCGARYPLLRPSSYPFCTQSVDASGTTSNDNTLLISPRDDLNYSLTMTTTVGFTDPDVPCIGIGTGTCPFNNGYKNHDLTSGSFFHYLSSFFTLPQSNHQRTNPTRTNSNDPS